MFSVFKLIATIWTVEEKCLTVIVPVLNHSITRLEFLDLLKFLICINLIVLNIALIVEKILLSITVMLPATGPSQTLIYTISGSTWMYATPTSFTVFIILSCAAFMSYYTWFIFTLGAGYAMCLFSSH